MNKLKTENHVVLTESFPGNGFTLIELIVVVGIIAMIVAIAVPRFTTAMENARGARILADLRNIDSAIVSAQVSNVTNPTFTTDGTTGVAPRFLLSLPVPPTGIARFPQGGTLTVPDAPTYRIMNNRAAIGTTGSGNLAENLAVVTTEQTY